MISSIAHVEVPSHELFRLVAAAERRGMTLPEFLLNSGRAVAGVGASGPDSIETLTRLGLTDRDIARRLGLTNATVATRRRRLGIPANHAPRRTA